MRLKLQTAAVLVIAIGCLLLAESSAAAQVDRTPSRVRIPATVRSFIGGESADSYIFRARQGTTVIVRVSWKRERANYASFIVTDADRDEEVPDAKESQDGRRWVGKIPKTGDYLISVGAHPWAQYTLRITLK